MGIWANFPASSASEASGLALWASAKVSGMTAIAKAMMDLRAGVVLPPPTPITPARITGNTRYCDPTWGGPFNGTFAQPYNSPTQATLAAGDGLLFKQGTTTTVSTQIVPAATGTAANRIIYGAYDAATGERIVGVPGAAKIVTTAATGAVFIPGVGRDYVCIDSLELQGGPVNTFAVVDGNGGLFMQVTNCVIHSGVYGIRFYGAGTVIQGNVIRNHSGDGIYVFLTGLDSDAVIQYNQIRDNGGSGVYAYDSGGSFKYTGTVACNVFRNNGGAVPGRAGVAVLNGGGACSIYRNHISRSPSGINLDGVGAASRDFSGALIENNDILDCGEFGIGATSARGRVIVQLNRIARIGSYDGGATAGTARSYGRGIELYGASAAQATSEFIVRWNWVSQAYCFMTDGSEGVGIGLDDNTRNADVYGNFVELCEGNGIQVNRGFGSRIFGNVVIDCLIAPASRGLSFTGAFAAQIFYIGNPNLQVFNNTCIFTGRAARTVNQLYGIAENETVLSRSARVFNNLIIGASYAGITRSQLANATVESNNRIVGSPRLVANCTSLATIAAGSGTAAATTGDLNTSLPIPTPNPGGALAAGGESVPGMAESFAGRDLGALTPIGALHAVAI